MKLFVIFLSTASSLLILTIASSCEDFSPALKGCRAKYDWPSDNNVLFNILDRSTKENLLEIGITKYNYDTVTVYNTNWERAYFGEVSRDGSVYLTFINEQEDKNTYQKDISRRFYMYFNYSDVDTIDITFQMKLDNCDDPILSYFKISYNDSVYFDSNVKYTPGIVFLKNADN